MTLPRCPLTHSADVRLLQSIKSSDVIKLYRRQNLDVAKEFEGIEEFGFYHALASDVKFFFPAACGSPAFYKQLQQRAGYYEKNKFEFEATASLIKPPMRVLEMGCGDGAFAKMLPLRQVSYLGIESNPSAVAVAKEAGINVQLGSIDDAAPPESGGFDMVCAFQVLEHLADVRGTLEKMLAKLSSGGYLILSVPNDDGFIGKTVNHIFNLPPHHVTRWSERAVRHIADLFKLNVQNILHEPLPKAHWAWYAQASFLHEVMTQLFPTRHYVIETRVPMRLFMKLSRFLAAAQRRRFPIESAKGHTLLAIFQKE